jgi:ABC-type transport system substrate-binding protein
MLRGVGLGAAGLAGAALIGCGDDDEAAPAATGAAATKAATAAPAGAAQVASKGKKGGTIVFGGWGLPRGLSPRNPPGGGTHMQYMNLYGDAYLFIKADGSYDPGLSLWESWEQVDPTTILVQLRKGVKFHDGQTFDAEYMKRHLDWISVAENVPNNFFFSWMRNYDSVEVISEYTAKLKAQLPDASFLARFALQPGTPFSLEQVEKLGDDELRNPSMTGAYIVDSYTEDIGFTLKANPEYWGPKDGAPTFDVIDNRGFRSNAIKAAAMQAGDLDAAWFGNSDESTLLLAEDSRFTGKGVSVAPRGVGINFSKPPLDDLRVRKAFVSAIDKQKIADIVYKGQTGPAHTGLMPPDVYASLSYDPHTFDLTEAKKLLDASGVETPVKLSYTYSGSGTDETLLMAQLYQESSRQIGFEVTLENAPSRGLSSSVWYAGEKHLSTSSPGVRPDPTMQYDLYASRVGPQPGSKYTTDPIQDTIDDLILQSNAEFDNEAREEIFFELSRLVADNVINSYAIAERVRWMYATDDIGGMDHPELVTAPGGAGYRMRFMYRKDA